MVDALPSRKCIALSSTLREFAFAHDEQRAESVLGSCTVTAKANVNARLPYILPWVLVDFSHTRVLCNQLK